MFFPNLSFNILKVIGYQYVFASFHRKEEAASRPKTEFFPKTLADLHVEGISDGLNGAPPLPPSSTGQYGRAPWHASQYNYMHASLRTGDTYPINNSVPWCDGLKSCVVMVTSFHCVVFCSCLVSSKGCGLFKCLLFQE